MARNHLLQTLLAAAATALLSACSTPGVRAVPEVLPGVGGHELDLLVQVDALTYSTVERALPTEGAFRVGSASAVPLPAPRVVHPAGRIPASAAAPAPGATPAPLPLLIDLGAGEFPYDDEIHPLDETEPLRGGLSSSVIQLSWRGQLDGPLGLHGTAAVVRTQDEAILDALGDARYGWLAVGFHTTF